MDNPWQDKTLGEDDFNSFFKIMAEELDKIETQVKVEIMTMPTKRPRFDSRPQVLEQDQIVEHSWYRVWYKEKDDPTTELDKHLDIFVLLKRESFMWYVTDTNKNSLEVPKQAYYTDLGIDPFVGSGLTGEDVWTPYAWTEVIRDKT